MSITLEAVYGSVVKLEHRTDEFGRIVAEQGRTLEKQEQTLLEVRDTVRDLVGEFRLISQHQTAELALLRGVPARVDVAEAEIKANAATLTAVLRNHVEVTTSTMQVTKETRDAWIGPEGFFRSKQFAILLAIVCVAFLILLRAVDASAVTEWWHGPGPQILMPQSSPSPPRGIEEMSALP